MKIEASKLGKRKRKVVTLEKKLNIIGELKKRKFVASNFEIPMTTKSIRLKKVREARYEKLD